MAQLSERYYRPSGKIPFAGTIGMLVVGSIVAFLGGFIYALISRYNPLVYIQMFVTFGFGIIMGLSVRAIEHMLKVRNRFFSVLISMLIGCLGLYFSWAWYIYILAEWDWEMLIFDPRVTWEIMKDLAVNGIWEIKGGKPTGWALYSFWILEAVIVLWSCYITSGDPPAPFCEECDCWTESKDKVSLPAGDIGELAETLEEENYAQITKLAAEQIDPADYLLVQSYACPKCEECGHLTVSTVKIVQGKEGPETNTEVVIPAIWVPQAVIEEVARLSATTPEVSSPVTPDADDTNSTSSEA